MIEVTNRIAIPEDELTFTAARSSGPGGQNVNKVSSRVTLRFDVEGSRVLSPEQKSLIQARLSSRVGKDGVLQISSQKYRTQSANKRAAIERFIELLAFVLKGRKPRKRTFLPESARRRRLEEKARQSELKRSRSKIRS